MAETDSSLLAGNHPALHRASSRVSFSGWVPWMFTAPVALSLLALLFLGACWLAGLAGAENLGQWILLTAASTFAIGYLAVKYQIQPAVTVHRRFRTSSRAAASGTCRARPFFSDCAAGCRGK